MGTFAIGGSSGFAIGPLFAGTIAYTIGPHGLAAFTVVGIIIFTILFVLMPRIVAHARTIDQAVATENPTVAAKPLKNYWNTWHLVHYHLEPIGKLPSYQRVHSDFLDS